MRVDGTLHEPLFALADLGVLRTLVPDWTYPDLMDG